LKLQNIDLPITISTFLPNNPDESNKIWDSTSTYLKNDSRPVELKTYCSERGRGAETWRGEEGGYL
jgi:hypothetical protein